MQSDDQNLVIRIWQELTRAPHDRHHAWRTPVLASIGLDGTPQARTLIIRSANSESWMLSAFTDRRSSKCEELKAHPAAQLVFWSQKLNWQLRVSASASIITDEELIDTTWQKVSQSKTSKDYLNVNAPSSMISSEAAEKNSLLESENHQFAIIQLKIIQLDWLELNREGHSRARILPNGKVIPLVP